MSFFFRYIIQEFLNKHCLEYDDEETHKLVYTNHFKQYEKMMEKHLEKFIYEERLGTHVNLFDKLNKAAEVCMI